MKICEAGRDSCGCDNWKKGIRTINGQYPDDNRDFDINAGSGILITPATAGITITNEMGAVTAGDNIVVTPSGDHLIVALAQNIAIGNLDVAGDIIQHGAAYETHMEKVYTVNDYIIMRDGAVSGLQSGEYSGFQVKKYDGTNDGRLVIDNTGTARVGDVGDEQPLLTREESADLSNGEILTWDAANSKAIGVPIDATPSDGSSNPVSSDGVYDALTSKVNITDLVVTYHGNYGNSTAVQSINIGTLLIQFGKITTNDASIVDIALPITYPDTSYISVVTQTTSNSGNAAYINGCCVTSRTVDKITFYNATNGTNSFNWICMGRNTV